MPLIRNPRPAAADAAHAGDTSATPTAIDLSAGDEPARWSAARAVSGDASYLEPLALALTTEPSARVRAALFSSLCAIATPTAVERILPFVRSDEASLRTGALDALHVMAPLVEPHLPGLLADHDADVQLLACELVRDVPAERACVLLTTLLDAQPSPNVCASAIEVLAEIGDARALPALERCAARLRGNAFIDYAAGITIERLRAQATQAAQSAQPVQTAQSIQSGPLTQRDSGEATGGNLPPDSPTRV